jgi:hypothetical protein
MPTKKITELTADTAPTSDDLIATVDDVAGTPTTKKSTIANLFFSLKNMLFASDSGSTDTYAATLSPAPSAYVTGQAYRFKANTANTGACTINFNSLGAKTIKKAAGGITTDLADNDIRAGQWVDLIYDGTNMQMQSQLGNVGTTSPAGSNEYIQYNNSGAFGASSRLIYHNDLIYVSQTSNGGIIWSNDGSTILSGIVGDGGGTVRAISQSTTVGGSSPGCFYSATNDLTDAGGEKKPWHNAGNVRRHVLTGNRTIGRPQSDGGSNSVSGVILTLILVQDGTGSRIVTWATEYKWVGGAAPTLSTGANKVDIFTFWCDGSNQAFEISRALDVR